LARIGQYLAAVAAHTSGIRWGAIMFVRITAAAVLALAITSPAFAQSALTVADKAAIFKAAGFQARGPNFTRCPDDPSASHSFGAIEVADLNSDGQSEAWVREGSTFCYGNTGQAVVLLTKGTDGAWKVLLDAVGIDLVEKTKHAGWPDISVGGPGMGPQPRFVFNGAKYVLRR
jgi:hypothetical protein